MRRSRTGRLFLGSAFILALAGVTPAVYAHGGDSTLIHACVNKSSGEVKIVGANASCKNNETALDWPGISAGGGTGWELVSGEVTFGNDGFVVLSCPSGKFVVNGGFIAVLSTGELRLVTAPGPALNGTGWALQGSPGNTEDAWAICVNP